METDFGKYLRLFGNLFFLFIGFIVSLILLFLGIRLFFGVLSYVPMVSYVYTIFILTVPAALFISAYIIYLKRTPGHPSKPIRLISYFIFIMALITWAVVYVLDMIDFFKFGRTDIGAYKSFNMFFLFGNVVCFFLIGIIQAFTTSKEIDWRERNNL